ncbi:hypothetical protein GCM10010341_40760 [Streptomyces noursei]|nr:hypothetical protein GCM10010341_40760 [Streptomyces noursei]
MTGGQFVRVQLGRNVQTLDRHLTTEDFVPGPPDGAHPALTYPLNQAISPGDQSPLIHRRRFRHRTPLRKPVRIQGATIVFSRTEKPFGHRRDKSFSGARPHARGVRGPFRDMSGAAARARSRRSAGARGRGDGPEGGIRGTSGSSRGISGISQGSHRYRGPAALVTMAP